MAKSQMGTFAVVAALGVGAWLLFKNGAKYHVGDRIQIEGLTGVTYLIEDIITVDKIKWYVLNDGTGQFRVEVEVVDRSPMWKKI